MTNFLRRKGTDLDKPISPFQFTTKLQQLPCHNMNIPTTNWTQKCVKSVEKRMQPCW